MSEEMHWRDRQFAHMALSDRIGGAGFASIRTNAEASSVFACAVILQAEARSIIRDLLEVEGMPPYPSKRRDEVIARARTFLGEFDDHRIWPTD